MDIQHTRALILVDWTCERCQRRGIVVVPPDEPIYPGVRAYRAHQSRLNDGGPQCENPSITWRRRNDVLS